MKVKVYVEGGGHHNKDLDTRCRQGFRRFFENAGLRDRMPRVIACGGRLQAFDSFRTSQENAGPDEFPILLVDSEEPVVVNDPWEHVRSRPGDGWQRPHGASREQIHFMVQAMEAWFHADSDALREYYGHCFQVAGLSQRLDVESIPKADLFAGLKRATKDCLQKGEYSKGQHSFQILALIDPAKVRTSSPVYAERLLAVLDQMCR